LSFILGLVSFFGAFHAIRESRNGAVLMLVLIFYPMIYYVTYVFSRYRYPIEPVIYVLAAYGVTIIANSVAAMRMIGALRPSNKDISDTVEERRFSAASDGR
jgi:hypothetical protein